jgi:hypothetical protein
MESKEAKQDSKDKIPSLLSRDDEGRNSIDHSA